MADLQITSSCSSSTGFALSYPLAGITGNRTQCFNELHSNRYGPSLLHIGLTSCYLSLSFHFIHFPLYYWFQLPAAELFDLHPFHFSPSLQPRVMLLWICANGSVSFRSYRAQRPNIGQTQHRYSPVLTVLVWIRTHCKHKQQLVTQFLGSLFPNCLKGDYPAHYKDCSNVKLLSLTLSVDIRNADKHESKRLPFTVRRKCVTAFLMMSLFIFVVSCWWSRWSCRFCTFGPSSTKTPSWPSGSEHSSR